MKKFEYIIRNKSANDFPLLSSQIVEWLDELGQDGWEMVGLTENKFINDPSTTATYRFYFKREIK